MNVKVLILFAAFIALASTTLATCDPPNLGDWNILNTESCGNESIQINISGDVNVNAGGYLELNDNYDISRSIMLQSDSLIRILVY